MKRLPTHRPRVAVIGGGISGLSAAFWLLQHDMDAVVFDQADRPGGLIRSEKIDGYLVDHAANCLLNFLPEVNTLCDVIGVKDEKTYRSPDAKNRYLLKEGHPVPLPRNPVEMISTSLLSLKGKMRFLAEPLVPRSMHDEDETVSRFVTRRFGHEILEQVMEPFIGGTYAGDPLNLCAKSTLPMFHSLEQRYGSLIIGAVIRRLKGSRAGCPMHLFSFQSGMETLPKAIAKYLGERFTANSRIQGIENLNNGSWRLFVSKDDVVTSIDADAVVIATPSDEASRLISSINQEATNLLKGIEYSPLAVVHTGFRKGDIDHPLDGIGCMVPAREKGRILLGSLWSSTLFSGRAPEEMVSLTNYVGGKRHPGSVEKSDSDLLDLTIRDIRDILKVKADPGFIRITRHQRAIPQYSLGHQEIVKRVESLPNLHEGLYITGNYLRGISVRDCISYNSRLAQTIASNHGQLVQ